MNFKVSSIAGLLVFGQALAVDRLDNVPDAKYLALGAQPQFGAVGQLMVTRSGSRAKGTGTFIGFGKRMAWVLTARHVVRGFTDGSTFVIGGNSYRFGKPIYYRNDKDIAVVPIVGVAQGDIPVAVFSDYKLDVAAKPSDRRPVYGVGYGISGTGTMPGTADDDRKRAFINTVDGLDVTTYQKDGKTVLQVLQGYAMDFDDGTAANNTLDAVDNPGEGYAATQSSSRTPTELEGGADSGDSGGPLFSEEGDGGWTVVGVTYSIAAGVAGKSTRGYGAITLSEAIDKDIAFWITSKTGIKPLGASGTGTSPEALRLMLYGY